MKFRETMTTYAQTVLKLDGNEYNVRTKSYGDNVEVGEVDGASQMAVGRTQGQYKTDESELEIYADDFADLIDRFGEEFYSKVFTVTNTYEVVGESKLTVDTLEMCRFLKRTASDEAGSADAMTRTVGFKPLYIKWNGKNPLKKMPTGLQ